MAETLGDRVHFTRRKRGLTQRELADRMGMTNVTISRIEKNAVTDIRPDTLIELAKALDVSTDYLLGLKDEDEEERLAAAH